MPHARYYNIRHGVPLMGKYTPRGMPLTRFPLVVVHVGYSLRVDACLRNVLRQV